MSNTSELKRNTHPFALSVCKVLNDHKFEAYLVGGVVRDTLLGKEALDIDIATNARPDDVFNLFEKAVYTGKAYGTVTVTSEEYPELKGIEITTYRSEGDYSNQRHPDSIVFEDDVHKDLSRRDFTINALAYDPIKDELIDDYDGLTHLKEKRLVTVGDPATRFKEDSLRLLRLCRFMSQLDFEVDEDTKAGFISSSKTATLPAKERSQIELEKLMNGKCPGKGLRLLSQSGFSEQLIPGLRSCDDAILTDLKKYDSALRWASLLQYLKADEVMGALMLSNKDQRLIKSLIDYDLDLEKAQFSTHDLAISGQELQELGYEGPEIGAIQKQLLTFVLEDLSRNTKEQLLAQVHPKK